MPINLFNIVDFIFLISILSFSLFFGSSTGKSIIRFSKRITKKRFFGFLIALGLALLISFIPLLIRMLIKDILILLGISIVLIIANLIKYLNTK